jgi:hypothetical protein
MSNELVKLQDGSLARVDSFNFQSEMFKKYGLSPTMVETHRFEKRGDKFALVKREKPVRFFDDGDGGIIALTAATTSEKVGLNKMRGKYGDENRLFDQDSASIKVGEVEAWSTI